MTSEPLEFPGGLFYLIEHQTWARFDGDGTAVVGITSLGIRLSGEVYMCRPQAVGTAVAFGRSVAVVELAKAIVSVKSPVDGVVAAVNPLLEERPELVHRDPYGEGWLARLAVADATANKARLAHGDAVAPAMAHHAWLNRETP